MICPFKRLETAQQYFTGTYWENTNSSCNNDCAMWDKEKKQCSILSIANSLDKIQKLGLGVRVAR